MAANQLSGQINSNRLLREIWLKRGYSRAQLAERLDLDKSTITTMVNKMMDLGILLTLSEGESSPRGGRKPLALGIDPEYGAFIGLELQPGSVTAVLVDLLGDVVSKKKLHVDFSGKDVAGDTDAFTKTLLPVLKSIYNEFSSQCRILGVGIALSGIINVFTGEVISSMVLDIGSPLLLADQYQKIFGCPVLIENDSNCCAWGELVVHRNELHSNSLSVLIKNDYFKENSGRAPMFAVGMGISLDGKVFYGKQFAAGEFFSVFKKGGEHSQFSFGTDQLQYIEKDPKIRSQLFREMSLNISLLVNSLNLNNIYVAGDVEPYWDELKEVIESEIVNLSPYKLPVCICNSATHGVFSPAYGAAVMHLERIFAASHISYFQEHSQPVGLEVLTGNS